MADNVLPVNGNVERSALSPDFVLKAGLARMLKGGVIMDVVNAQQVFIYFASLFFFFLLSHHSLGRDDIFLSVFNTNILTNTPPRHESPKRPAPSP